MESLGGLAGGTVTGAAILLIFTPVGWVAALAVSVGGAISGYAAGKAFSHLYDTYGNKVNIVSATGASQLCR